jgi:hypothetical protein
MPRMKKHDAFHGHYIFFIGGKFEHYNGKELPFSWAQRVGRGETASITGV